MKFICEFNKPYFIYKITNIIDSKVYIGRTADPKSRHSRYCYLAKNYNLVKARFRKVNKVMRDVGLQNFEFEVIEKCKTYSDAKKREDFYITTFDSTNPTKGYNEKGGEIDSASLKKFKKMMSERMSGDQNPMFGKKRSDKVKNFLSNKFSGSQNPFYGKTHSEDAKKRIGITSSERNTGAGNPNSKLSEHDVIEIRRKYNTGECTYLSELAGFYGVTNVTISNIIRYKTWKHV